MTRAKLFLAPILAAAVACSGTNALSDDVPSTDAGEEDARPIVSATEAGDGPVAADAGRDARIDSSTPNADASPVDANDADAPLDDAGGHLGSPGSDGGGRTSAVVLTMNTSGVYCHDAVTGGWVPGVKVGPVPAPGMSSGGGIDVTPAGVATIAFRQLNDSSPTIVTRTGGGAGTFTKINTGAHYIGSPVGQPTRVLVPLTSLQQIALATLDRGTSTWSVEPVGAGATDSQVALAVTAADEPLIAFGGLAVSQYAWTKRSAGVWSAAAPITGISVDQTIGAPAPVLVKRVGKDEIVGLFVTDGATGTSLSASIFSGGAWSAPAEIATHLAPHVTNGYRPVAATALDDGRVAVAYQEDTAGPGKAIRVGFLSGSTWLGFDTVPDILSAWGEASLSIAPGRQKAVLEMVYADPYGTPFAMKLDASGTWFDRSYVTSPPGGYGSDALVALVTY